MIDGYLTRFDGAVLTLVFVLLLVTVARLEMDADRQYLAAEEARDVAKDGEAEVLVDGDRDKATTERVDEGEQRKGWHRLGIAVLR